MVASVSASAAGPAPDREALLAELGRGRTVINEGTGIVRFVGGTTARPAAPRERLGNPAGPRAAARAFMTRYGTLFGIRDAQRGLRIERVTAGGTSGSVVRIGQLVAGRPVIGAELLVQVDGQDNVVSVIGEATASRLATDVPSIDARQAASVGRAHVARGLGLDAGALAITQPVLAVYDPRLVGAPGPAGARLVWQLEVSAAGQAMREYVLVDAASGAIALRFSLIAGARDRVVCDAAEMDAEVPCETPVLTESSGSSSEADVNNLFTYAGDWYDFFYNRFARDSLDGAGTPLVSTARYCFWDDCTTLNAFWDGVQAAFWPGMVTDDIVAHEFSHGLTQYSSGLFYYSQSGAINEALSDIFGELVDLTNAEADDPSNRWLMGETSIAGVIRDMADPPAYGSPDRMQSALYWGDEDDGHGVHTNSGVANKAAYLMVDGDTFNGQTVAGIGLDRAAAIWYRVATAYLWSASDYADLGLGLSQACSDLVGSAVRDSSGAATGTIEAAHCDQVAKAVLATQMALPPTAAGATAPPAPLCTTGTYSEIFLDDIDDGLPGWTVDADPLWAYSTQYARSGAGSLWGMTPSAPGSDSVVRASAVTLPANAFLNFSHAYLFDHDSAHRYDGGRLEYQVGIGAWLDAKTLFTHNGYNGKIAAYSGGGNPLAGQDAFVGYSPGYLTSRVNLSSLTGQSVRFRFRTGTDWTVEDFGWFVDDVRLYSCGGSADTVAPTVSAPNANLRTNVIVSGTKPIKLSVSFSATDDSAIASTGLQRRTNLNSYNTVTLGSATATSVDLAYVASTTKRRQFRARASDTPGNLSDWSTASPFRILAFQNGSSAVVQSGTWKLRSSSSHYGGSARSSNAAGAKQRLSGTFSDLAVVSTLGPNRGRAEVWVDGALAATVDLYAPSLVYRRVVFAVDFGASSAHAIEFRVTGTRNAASTANRVDFDAFLGLAP
jgi:Zn-dependent metalloprotease